jgi:hypothetical protein
MRRRIIVESSAHHGYGYSDRNLGNVAEHCYHFAPAELTGSHLTAQAPAQAQVLASVLSDLREGRQFIEFGEQQFFFVGLTRHHRSDDPGNSLPLHAEGGLRARYGDDYFSSL